MNLPSLAQDGGNLAGSAEELDDASGIKFHIVQIVHMGLSLAPPCI